MLYDVLVVSNGGGGKRLTIERDAPLSVGDTFEQDSESYRVLATQTGHGPFDGVIEAEHAPRRIDQASGGPDGGIHVRERYHAHGTAGARDSQE